MPPNDVLGITSVGGGFHDSSVAWVRDGEVQFALSEERLSRIKHDYAFPAQALRETLRYSGLKPSDFSGVAVGWMAYNPFSGFFSRSLFDVPGTALRSLTRQPQAFARYVAKNFLQKKLLPGPNLLVQHGFRPEQVHFFSHHLAHAASSYRTSGFDEALSVNLDCFGPDDQGNLWSGASFICRGGEITPIDFIPPYASLGLFYSAISVCLGFRFGDGEGKTMGLAAYGDARVAYQKVRMVSPTFRAGRWHGHTSWSDFRLIDNPTLLFASKWGRHLRETMAATSREDIAAAAQRILEEELTAYFDHLLKKTGMRNVVLAGGTFLNVTFNRKLVERLDVAEVFVHPFPSDGGTAVGSALELSRRMTKGSVRPRLATAALGPESTEEEIRQAIEAVGPKVSAHKPADLPAAVATEVARGAIVGWFQGRAEWGPRALGRRSVLGDPRQAGTKERLNRLLKNRDWFMPFAPSVLEEFADEYFEKAFYAPFMTFAFRVRPERISKVPEIVHADGTARPHVVRETENPLYHRMISSFRDLTGVPIVLNTSFNRHGLPLVNTPSEALNHLLWGCFDILAIGGFIVSRVAQPEAVDAFTQNALIGAYTDETALNHAHTHQTPSPPAIDASTRKTSR
ncbi:MAG TPA: carbamoyltransferase C-terminal domain-containing protein [Opitutaceae bacterium]|nr:carbamoyltransferase C-terminal domain-containing protein [Opitutaceae bacterium]